MAHAAHVNVVGTNFYQDHLLFERIYTDLQEQIDTYAEFLRTIDGFMPPSIKQVVKESVVSGSMGDEMISELITANKAMIDCLEVLYETAEEEGECGLSNYAQDRLIAHKKHQWMLKSSR
jgi:starvation-inducible DNA-binding protein